MSYSNAYNETHQWARTIDVYPSNAPTAAGQLVTLTSNGWELATSATLTSAAQPIKVVKSVDDTTLSDSGALVRGTTVSEGPKVTVYWNNFVGEVDNLASVSFAVGDELTVDANGKLTNVAATGTVMFGVVEGIGKSDDEAEVSGAIAFTQTSPYVHA